MELAQATCEECWVCGMTQTITPNSDSDVTTKAAPMRAYTGA
ncbi:MAG TPA: hypothetical protein VFK65_15150 [Candidatus Binatia bacterium]|nr:hypothetical protein [Candidatus Binatia bacterium]